MPTDDTYILAIDQGTSGTSASLYDRQGRPIAAADAPVSSIFPQPGWVDQDPHELLDSIRLSAQRLIAQTGVSPAQIDCLGVANQGEPLLLWDIASGAPVYPAIGWQCVRSAGFCEGLIQQGYEPEFRLRTGMPLHPEWPATKIGWVYENCPASLELLKEHRLVFSSLDTWFIYQLTGEKRLLTDVSTAARTGLYNLNTQQWDPFLIELFGAQDLLLPEVVGSEGDFGNADLGIGRRIPWRGNALDQAAALLGQACFAPGETKITYGTCSALWVNLGARPVQTPDLATSIAWKIKDDLIYAIDGESGTAGAAINWLRDQLGLTSDFSGLSAMAESLNDSSQVLFVPALYGLGAPHWAPAARGAIFGLSSATGMPHLVRAALEAVAFSIRDVLESIERLEGIQISGQLIADGGMTANPYLMQFQADVLGRTVLVPANQEGTSAGVAFLAGLASGFYPSLEFLKNAWQPRQAYTPHMDAAVRAQIYRRWQQAIWSTLEMASSG